MEQNETALLEKREVREQYMDRLDVLDKVKQLFLIPDLEVMTIRQVAEWFEVEPAAVKKCYQRHYEEINPDGTIILKPEQLSGQNVPLVRTRGGAKAEYDEFALTIPFRGMRAFSKRAVLRIAMLLRDGVVAKEIRTQLLNTFEQATPVQRTTDITEEERHWNAIGKAFSIGTKEDAIEASRAYFEFINRHVAKLEKRNQTLEEVNQALIAENLTWNDRAKINKAVRFIGGRCGKWTGVIWNELYSELLYKHSISLRKRGSAPYIQYVRETEWPMVQQSLLAVCGVHGIDIEKVLEAARIA